MRKPSPSLTAHDDHTRMDFFRRLQYPVDRVTSNSTDKMSEQVLIHGYARFVDPHTLEVNGETIKAGKIIIATGSRPIVPEAWKDFGDKVITTDELFELKNLPESAAVIGLGVIGLEIGQSLSRMDIDVTGIELSDTISGIQDPALQQVAIDVIGKEFPLWFGNPAELSTEGDKLRVTASNHSVLVDKVIATLGRTPNLTDLNLAGIGIDCDERGIPRFNPNTMQVEDTIRVYADKATGIILGAAIMAPRAENLAHLICWAIEKEQTVFDLLRMPFYHPVIEEALQAALYDLKDNVDAEPPEGLLELESIEV